MKGKILDVFNNASQDFILNRMDLISDFPKIFSSECLLPEHSSTKWKNIDISQSIINKMKTRSDNENSLQTFMSIIQTEEQKRKALIPDNIFADETVKESSREDSQKDNKEDEEEDKDNSKESLFVKKSIKTISVADSQNEIILGGKYLNSAQPFSFKDENSFNNSFYKVGEEAEGDSSIIQFTPAKSRGDFLETSQDKGDMEFENLLVSNSPVFPVSIIPSLPCCFYLSSSLSEEEIRWEIGYPTDKRFQIIYIGDTLTKSSLLNMSEVVVFFDTLQDLTNVIISNTKKNLVYDYFYFTTIILPVMKRISQLPIDNIAPKPSPNQNILEPIKPSPFQGEEPKHITPKNEANLKIQINSGSKNLLSSISPSQKSEGFSDQALISQLDKEQKSLNESCAIKNNNPKERSVSQSKPKPNALSNSNNQQGYLLDILGGPVPKKSPAKKETKKDKMKKALKKKNEFIPDKIIDPRKKLAKKLQPLNPQQPIPHCTHISSHNNQPTTRSPNHTLSSSPSQPHLYT
jgi:hypothetical protein